MNQIIRQVYPVTRNGEDIYLFTLQCNEAELRITNYGAIVTHFRLMGSNGKWNDIVLGFDKIEDYWAPAYLAQNPFFGAIVGRYGNRIGNARFSIDGTEYKLIANMNKDTLHGGPEALDKKCWRVASYGTEPYPFVEFSYLSPDNEQGFPGDLDCHIRYTLTDKREMDIQIWATTSKPTPVNFTTHHYFNLHNGEGTIHDHQLQILAAHILEQDKELVVTGKYVDVEGTTHDLRKGIELSEGLKLVPEYDQSFVLDKGISASPLRSASLSSSGSPWKLELWTTEPVCHFYTGKWIPLVTGKNNQAYGAFSGLCLETQIHPNAVNIPSFPNTILRPGETYRQHTIYRVLPEK